MHYLTMVNVLVVYAHPEDTSLNAATLEVTVRTLTEAGHQVVVSDLYKQNFQPVLGRHDITGELVNPDHFQYSKESLVAMREGRMAPDILQEHKKVKDADILIFQFPLYWLGLPAILKGWFDRVFTQGFAFDLDDMFEQGYFKGKKAMLSFTTGGPRAWYTSSGPMGDIEVILWPLQNSILRFVGFDVLSPNIFFGTDAGSKEHYSQCLKRWETRLRTLHEESPIYFFPLSDYKPLDPENPRNALSLKQEAADRNSTTLAPSIGQHMGRPLPAGTMYRPAANVDQIDLAVDVTGYTAT